jgi:hypothetical protein
MGTVALEVCEFKVIIGLLDESRERKSLVVDMC